MKSISSYYVILFFFFIVFFVAPVRFSVSTGGSGVLSGLKPAFFGKEFKYLKKLRIREKGMHEQSFSCSEEAQDYLSRLFPHSTIVAKRSGEAGIFYDVLLCNYGNLQFVSKIQSNGISELVRLISHNMFIRDQYNVQVGMTVKALKKKRQAMESKMENGQLLYFQRGSHIGYLMSAGPQGVIVGEASEGMLEVEAIVWSESRWDAN